MQLTTNVDYLESFCELILVEFEKQVANKDNLKMLSISYGYKLFSPDAPENLNNMLDQTDLLMYQHKRTKKSIRHQC